MKDKYFGDEHDFRKYGLLQFLQGGCTSGWEWKVCLNWMRTKFEPALFNNDGNRRSYDLLKKTQNLFLIN